MQRITQMSVTPDLLAEISPEANLEIKIAGNSIEPGSYALPSQVSTYRTKLYDTRCAVADQATVLIV